MRFVNSIFIYSDEKVKFVDTSNPIVYVRLLIKDVIGNVGDER